MVRVVERKSGYVRCELGKHSLFLSPPQDQVEQLQRQMVIMAAESAGREDRMTKEVLEV